MALSRYIGLCLSEYAQTTQGKVDYHTYPSGTTIIKAFIANDVIVYNDRKHILKESSEDFLQRAHFVKIPGRYKRTARTANQLPLWQKVINLKYAPCAAQCDWYYMPGG